MIRLDLTIMLVDSVSAKIYLAYLNKKGYKAKNILLIKTISSSRKYQLIKNIVGAKVADFIYRLYIRSRDPSEDIESSQLANKFLNLHGLTLDDLGGCLETYDDNEIIPISVTNINDGVVANYLKSNEATTVLYTGGGILKEDILSTPNVKFIHIHPGIVPDIRGADCLFWSFLLRGKAGYSAFYMNAGIDAGDALIKKEYPVEFKKIDLSNYDNDSLYINILRYYDPCLRIKTFVDLLKSAISNQQSAISNQQGLCLSNLQYEKQEPNEGRMFFFMHKELRNFVINKMKEI